MSIRESEVFAPKRKKRRKPELAVQKACLARLRNRGALVAVTDAGAAYRAGAFFGSSIPAGWPDITGMLPGGRFIGVECKARGRRQSPAQKQMERQIRRLNGIYVLAHSVAELEEAIDQA